MKREAILFNVNGNVLLLGTVVTVQGRRRMQQQVYFRLGFKSERGIMNAWLLLGNTCSLASQSSIKIWLRFTWNLVVIQDTSPLIAW